MLGKELAFLDASRATKGQRLPVVFSREEITHLHSRLTGQRLLMFWLMYGGGLRHKECRRLRIKDIEFDLGHIVVRNGKGDKDRVTVLPETSIEQLRRQIDAVRIRHERDLQKGFGEVYRKEPLAAMISCFPAFLRSSFPAIFSSSNTRMNHEKHETHERDLLHYLCRGEGQLRHVSRRRSGVVMFWPGRIGLRFGVGDLAAAAEVADETRGLVGSHELAALGRATEAQNQTRQTAE